MNLTDIAFPIHMIGLAVAFGGILFADKLAFSWVRGKVETLRTSHLGLAHTIVFIALGLLITSGLIMFWPGRAYYLSNPAFWIKMIFVGALIVNSFVIGGIMHVAARKPFRDLTRAEKLPLFVSGAVSTLSWGGAALAALFL